MSTCFRIRVYLLTDMKTRVTNQSYWMLSSGKIVFNSFGLEGTTRLHFGPYIRSIDFESHHLLFNFAGTQFSGLKSP
ncbi:MAG: hypothetical protein IPI77_20025 [Saprospiraceae bacterium]|nr:hypothetical protein [Saprospiraceae bacterium]